MSSFKTLVVAALAGSASFVNAAPVKEKRERNDLTPKVIMDNVRSVSRVFKYSPLLMRTLRIGARRVSFPT